MTPYETVLAITAGILWVFAIRDGVRDVRFWIAVRQPRPMFPLESLDDLAVAA